MRSSDYFLTNSAESASRLREVFAELASVTEDHWLSAPRPYRGRSVADQAQAFSQELPYRGEDLLEVIRDVGREVIGHSLAICHPRSMAHFQCAPALASQAAEFLVGLTNQSLDSWDQAPAATLLELNVLRWFCELAGWTGRESSGVFVSGGTMANQMAVLLARNRAAEQCFGIDVQRDGMSCDGRLGTLRIVGSEEMHFSFSRAAAWAGLGVQSVVETRVDRQMRIDIARCRETLDELREQGKRVMLVAGVAGSTSHGSFDDLTALGALAREHGAWFHVDAAFGGGLLCSREHRGLLKGIEHADSIAIDPHKFFYQSLSCGVFLLRDRMEFRRIGAYADYLNPAEHESRGIPDLVSRSIQTSRRFDALKVYMTFRHMGVEGLARCIDRTMSTARAAADALKAHPNFELWSDPQSNVIVFRLKAAGLDDRGLDELNRRLPEQAYLEGHAALSSTTVRGRTWIKACLTNPQTTSEDFDQVLSELQALGLRLIREQMSLVS